MPKLRVPLILTATILMILLLVPYLREFHLTRRIDALEKQFLEIRRLVDVYNIENGEPPQMPRQYRIPEPLPPIFDALATRQTTSPDLNDPFGKANARILYWTSGKRNEVFLISRGPNRRVDLWKTSPVGSNDFTPFAYDPTNGAFSSGDIVFSLSLVPN